MNIPIREYFPLFPDGKKKVFTLSFDDGVEQDIRLVSLMKAYGVKGTFNLNSGIFRDENAPYTHPLMRRLPKSEIVKLFSSEDTEVAVHGLVHPFWANLPAENALYDILQDRRNLEEIFRRPIRGAAYPYGSFNKTVIEQLQKAGIRYARTVRDTEDFRLPEHWLTLDPTCHFANTRLEELTDRFLSEESENQPMMFYVWGHSYEFEALNNWDVMERLLDRLGGRNDVWFATNMEIYEYLAAVSSLDFSLECSTVKNPSALTVWLQKYGEVYQIDPGQTTALS